MRFLMAATLLVSLLLAGPARAEDEPVVNLTRPTITGAAAWTGTVQTDGGAWSPADVTLTYQWLVDGAPIPGATGVAYSPTTADIGHQVSVVVTATDGLSTASATSDPSAVIQPATFGQVRRPKVTGVRRFEQTLKAKAGRWGPSPVEVRYRWLRGGEPIPGATKKRYRLGVEDVGGKVSVRVTVARPFYADAAQESKKVKIKHRVDVRRTVTYSVATRGHIVADLVEFGRQAQETFDDPRGWRGSGIRFVRVAKGGSFTLFLSQAGSVPSFGYPCDSYFSCRVGNAVIINQDRWLGTTPVWKASKRGVRDYRHLVVNHESGHWLGHRHSGCPGPGKPAPVMMQQSKGLHGCLANPWPVPSER